MDQLEVVCPEVADPGTFFLCHADVPRGTGLYINVSMSDDVQGLLPLDSTGWLKVPGMD